MISSFSRIIVVVVLVFAACSPAKKVTKADEQTLENLKLHIQYLADDKLEGRRTGTNGEKMAMEYISNQFKSIGLLPKGSKGYYQPFEINEGKQIDDSTKLIINGNNLVAGKDFFPFPFSLNQKMEALPSISVQEADMPWFFDLKEQLEENKANPHFDLANYIYTNSKKAKDRGASAVILYNTSSIDDKLTFNGKDKSEQLTIPVLYVTRKEAQKYFKDPSATIDIKFTTALSEKKRTGHNVVGYIDNGAATTVVLGAHFDHLGYGEDGNSRNTSTERIIHNGADDNASGTAALIELAKKMKQSKANNNNYLFIAFSGEELGLYGSKYFTENPTIDLKTANYMINMDMVGRLSDSTKSVTIGGYGTSPTWSSVISMAPGNSITVKIDSSGTGPSDHTSFYRKDIPVLFYFTGLHTDYHKPSDDADKINYNGIASILQHTTGLVESLNSSSKLSFLKTRETQTTTSARFSVTMGVMPDYTYSGTGLRADGVSEGKPAQKAGLKAGDIILQIGDYKITSMETYMQTLGKFKKGDKTKVIYKRGNDTLETTVEF
ncbi:MAG TPA: M20/M25/M40 family metallo-hydrolase [Chitinophagaceae bacterium]|nr:M20/M25/M40 family metallo-hydrolase [Chitinophagaceae bacterium]HQX72749.1 M20/M25/M40 family metallo-hydrolase [Chitinophagaceae bacterium]